MALGSCVTPFTYDPDLHKGTSFIVNPKDPKDPSRSKTSQQFKDESDINNIVENFVKTGVLPDDVLARRQAIYGDAVNSGTYLEAMNIIARAKESFETLDAKTRERFEHDPAKLLDFMADPKNADECIELGLFPEAQVEVYKKAKAEAAEKANAAAKAAADAAAAAKAEAGEAGAAKTGEAGTTSNNA